MIHMLNHLIISVQYNRVRLQIIQPTRCNSFTSLLLDVHAWLVFRASPRPSSGAYNRTKSLWFYRWREVTGALLVMVWLVITCQTTTNNTPAASGYNLPGHDQQRSSRFSPMVNPEALSAVVHS